MWNFCVPPQVTSRSSLPPIVFKNPLMSSLFMFAVTVHRYILPLAVLKCQNQILRGTGREH